MNATVTAATRCTVVTPEQLQLAWRHINRPGWPATLDAALKHPVYSVCLHALARQLNRPGFAYAHPVKPPQVLHSAPPLAHDIRRRTPPGMQPFDAKRAAANDKADT